MNKIFKLKDWLTLEETARRLSTSFGESVSVADCLQLALDGHITISALFGGNFYVVRSEEVITTQRQELRKMIIEETPEGAYLGLMIGDSKRFATNDELDKEYLTIERIPPVIKISHDVYDLPNPMIGAEELDVMHLLDVAQGRVPRQFVNMEGAFLKIGNNLYNKMESFNELVPLFSEDKNKVVIVDKVTQKEVDFHNYSAMFYPDDGLRNMEFVFRRKNIEDFENSTMEKENANISLDEGLQVIGAMINALKKTPNKSKQWTQDYLKSEMLEHSTSISSRQIDNYFSEANKSFKSKR